MMKKIYILLAALVAFVGCSVEGDNLSAPKSKFSLNANIESPRVSVTGEKYTEVNWEAGDVVQLVSEAGVAAKLYAESAGKSTRFSGEGEMKASVDTYYAVYGSSNTYSLSGSVVSLNYATQSGGDDSASVLLVGKAENVAPYGISMPFNPANALLHVAVTGISKISKAELMTLNGDPFATAYSYNIATDKVTHTATGNTITVTNPSASGFFFALPAGLELPNFVVRLTDGVGNTRIKAYASTTFAKGSTVRINFAWATPTVTLGAKSSYSYYAAGDATSANKVPATTIYFGTGVNGESCASTYANVQNSVIEDVGFELDGVDYSYQTGQVTWVRASKSFQMNSNVSPSYNTAWGEKTNIKAFVKVDGKKFYSTNKVWITGLPYDYTFSGNLNDFRNDGWTTNGSLDYGTMGLLGRTQGVVLQSNKNTGYIVSPKFMMPANISVQPSVSRSNYYLFWGGTKTRTGYVGVVANTSSKSTAISYTCKGNSSTGGTVYGRNEWLSAMTLSTSNPYISLSCDNGDSGTVWYFFVHDVHLRYKQ
jgi:hypothetical protein